MSRRLEDPALATAMPLQQLQLAPEVEVVRRELRLQVPLDIARHAVGGGKLEAGEAVVEQRDTFGRELRAERVDQLRVRGDVVERPEGLAAALDPRVRLVGGRFRWWPRV